MVSYFQNYNIIVTTLCTPIDKVHNLGLSLLIGNTRSNTVVFTLALIFSMAINSKEVGYGATN